MAATGTNDMSPGAGRGALVTGAGRRLGAAIGEALAADGWAVALHYNSAGDGATALARRIRAGGGLAVTVGADLSVRQNARDLVPKAADALAREAGCTPSLLVNNAALFEPDDAPAVDGVWEAHMAINLLAPVLASRVFIDRIGAEGESTEGLIVNILDRSVANPPTDFIAYTVSKSALWQATKIMAKQAAPRVRVNAIGPGSVLRHPRQSAGHFAAQAKATPLGHQTAVEEVTAALRFIIANRSLTGEILLLDGGHHLL